eukprot:151898_1
MYDITYTFCGLLAICLLVLATGYIFTTVRNYHDTRLSSVLLWFLYYLDIVFLYAFNYHLWYHKQYTLATLSSLFIACRMVYSVRYLRLGLNQWTNDAIQEKVNEYLSKQDMCSCHSIYFYALLSGSSHGLIHLLNSNLFGLRAFNMGLTTRHLIQYDYSTRIPLWIENTLQFIIEYVYIYGHFVFGWESGFSTEKKVFYVALITVITLGKISFSIRDVCVYNSSYVQAREAFLNLKSLRPYSFTVKADEICQFGDPFIHRTQNIVRAISQFIGVEPNDIEINICMMVAEGAKISFILYSEAKSESQIIDYLKSEAFPSVIQEHCGLYQQPVIEISNMDQQGMVREMMTFDPDVVRESKEDRTISESWYTHMFTNSGFEDSALYAISTSTQRKSDTIITFTTTDPISTEQDTPQSLNIISEQIITSSINTDETKSLMRTEPTLVMSETHDIHIEATKSNNIEESVPMNTLQTVHEAVQLVGIETEMNDDFVQIQPAIGSHNSALDDMTEMNDEWECTINALILAFNHLTHFKNGMVSCPNKSTQTNGNASPTFNQHKQSSVQNRCRDNGDRKDNSDHNKRNYRQNKKNGKPCMDSGSSTHCTHLSDNECAECGHILRQKDEQIKMFKQLLYTLQQQHEYHTEFENMICKAFHQNAKLKSKLKQVGQRPINTLSYDPIKGAKKHVKVSRELTDEIIPKTIKENISHVYSYLDKSIGMQYNDKQIIDDDDECVDDTDDCKHLPTEYHVINMDFHDKISNEPLYCVMQRMDTVTQRGHYKWQLNHKLYSAKELQDRLQISEYMPPVSSRGKLRGKTDMNGSIYDVLKHVKSIKSDIKCKWNKIPVFNRKQHQKRMTLSITQEQLNPMIEKCLLNLHGQSLIPILMFNSHSHMHWVEYVAIINIPINSNMCTSIGISLVRREDRVQITGIHLDKQMLRQQHEVLHCIDCHCFDVFTSMIDDIHVGNPDALFNQVKDFKHRHRTLKQLILKFINGKDTEKYEILQQHAEAVIKNDNGSLAFSLGDLDNSSMASRSPWIHSMQSYSDSPSSNHSKVVKHYGGSLSAASLHDVD